MREILIQKNKVVIRFDYEAHLVSIVTAIPGRVFDSKAEPKRWVLPLTQATTVKLTLKPFDFTMSDEFLELCSRQMNILLKSKRIKTGEFKDSENELLNSLGVPLHLYQKIGSGFGAAVMNSLIGDQPGLGKTIQSLSTTQLKKAKKVLVFCPVSMKKSWQEEIEKWYPSATSIIIGGTPAQRKEQWLEDRTYYIINYALLLRDLDYMKKIAWDFIIADEATAISNPSSETSKRLKKLKTVSKIALTGTPISNKADDVWSIMDWLQPGLLGNFMSFTDEYCMKDAFGSVTGYKNISKLKERIEPFLLRRLKSDVLTELPAKTYENIYVEFSANERKLYTSIQETLVKELRDMGMLNSSNLGSALVKMIRLRQMADSSELVNGNKESSKLDALKELLPIVLSGDDKAIIFTNFKEMAVILMRELAQYKPLLIAGGVSQDERDANRHNFNNNEENKLLIMTSAGSMGLNLQRASSVIHYDLPWSVAMAEQREDRAHRHGQLKNVTIYRMLAQNTIDEYILKTLYNKKHLSEQILGDEDIDEIATSSVTESDIVMMLK